MNLRNRGIALLIVQFLLVSSIGGKYLYERMTRPRVWVRVAQYDPNLPMRGRYMSLSAEVDACGLPRDKESSIEPYWSGPQGKTEYMSWHWNVTTKARDGKLIAEDARNLMPQEVPQSVDLSGGQPCDRVRLSPPMLFFIADTANPPFPSKPGQELWAEVTVPRVGPPRPIQLAMSENEQWKVLKMD
jgi:hypothetical protein